MRWPQISVVLLAGRRTGRIRWHRRCERLPAANTAGAQVGWRRWPHRCPAGSAGDRGRRGRSQEKEQHQGAEDDAAAQQGEGVPAVVRVVIDDTEVRMHRHPWASPADDFQAGGGLHPGRLLEKIGAERGRCDCLLLIAGTWRRQRCTSPSRRRIGRTQRKRSPEPKKMRPKWSRSGKISSCIGKEARYNPPGRWCGGSLAISCALAGFHFLLATGATFFPSRWRRWRRRRSCPETG